MPRYAQAQLFGRTEGDEAILLYVQFTVCVSRSIPLKTNGIPAFAVCHSTRLRISISNTLCMPSMTDESTVKRATLPWECSATDFMSCALWKLKAAFASSAFAKPMLAR